MHSIRLRVVNKDLGTILRICCQIPKCATQVVLLLRLAAGDQITLSYTCKAAVTSDLERVKVWGARLL